MHDYNDRVKNRLSNIGGTLYVFLALVTATVSEMAGATERSLTFHHTHTGEQLTVTFPANGAFIDYAPKEVNAFLSDFRTGAVMEIDAELLNILYDLRESVGSDGTYEVISGYRSPATNEMLRKQGRGVARNSQHVQGKAIDVRLRGVDTRVLRDAAIALQRGGVGYYEASDFVHVDTGRVRRW